MMDTEVGRFTVAVFQDVDWARRGLEALERHGFQTAALSLLALATPEAETLASEVLGGAARRFEVRGLGALVGGGPVIGVLDGTARNFCDLGLAATMRRAGFQAHDGYIYETLTSRGGVLVAVDSEARSADAIAVFHNYGGGNAAIGAWTGRV
jgi:hypothetical protein